jgi:hypothetical protein
MLESTLTRSSGWGSTPLVLLPETPRRPPEVSGEVSRDDPRWAAELRSSESERPGAERTWGT